MSKLRILNGGKLFNLIVEPLIEDIDRLEYNYSEILNEVTYPRIAAILLEEILGNGDPRSIAEALSEVTGNRVPFNVGVELTINIPMTRVHNEAEGVLGTDEYERLVEAIEHKGATIARLTRSRLAVVTPKDY